MCGVRELELNRDHCLVRTIKPHGLSLAPDSRILLVWQTRGETNQSQVWMRLLCRTTATSLRFM